MLLLAGQAAFAEYAQVFRANIQILKHVIIGGDLVTSPSSPTACADNGGGTAASCTLTPISTLVLYTCSDSDGCAMTLSESGAQPGQQLIVYNVGANVLTFADSAGVQELPASASLAITETISFIYNGTAWIESGRILTGNISGDLTVSGGDITGANSESINIGSTDATFKLIRNTSGIVTLTAADDDATAALTVLPGGAAAMVIGGASTTALTVTTDSTGNAEVVLPNASIGTAELTRPMHSRLRVCGDATTVNNNTVFYGFGANDVVQAITSSATIGQLTCDTTAAGNTTEASVDGPVFTGTAFGVAGMVCWTDTPGATVTFKLRSATADLTPSVTCNVATGAARTCVANTQTTTDVASAATFDLAVSSASDLGTIHFICDVDVVF